MSAMRYLPLILAWLWPLPLTAATQSPAASLLISAQTEVTATLYLATATQAAAQKVAGARLRAQRQEIESLRVKVSAGEVRLRSELVAQQEKYLAELAARDRAYAQEIAVFRNAVESIASTPEGVAALARFNAGDEVGALTVLDDLRAAQDAAERKGYEIRSVVRGRHNAMLALEARNRGKVTTAQVIDAMWRDSVERKGVLSKARAEEIEAKELARSSARRFFSQGNYRTYCDLVDLDPTWVAALLNEYACIEC